ncbi:MAG: enoyl-CoA hydratase [Acidobacteria bacterium]|nr:enoyl-CoA hydratase [Acidobacteriota bacterium]
MPYQEILYQAGRGVATITLNRPDRLNAWTARMEQESSEAFRAAADDEAVRVIVLTGAGRGFCAGADMSLLKGVMAEVPGGGLTADVPLDPEIRRDYHRKHAWLLTLDKPIVAAINGPAVGLGFVIPLYCDLRIASSSASFCTIFSKRGLVAEYGMSWMLPRLVGVANTVDLLFTSRKVDAAEALRMGLVHRVLPEAEFSDGVRAFAEELASGVSPRSLRVMKRQIYEAQFQTLGEAVDLAFEEMARSFSSEDFREGVAHFLEKRAPAFTGR